MPAPKGYLVVPVAFDADGYPRGLTVDGDDYLQVAIDTSAGGTPVAVPKGELATLVAFDADGYPRALEVDSADHLLITLLGGLANQILASDGTKAAWSSLATLLATLLTTNGDLLYRNGSGVVTRLPIGSTDEVLTVAGGLPDWLPGAGGGYTEGARVYNSGNQNVASSTEVALAFDSERYDTDGIHSTVTNSSRLTCKTAGKYLITGTIKFSANATGFRQASIRLNGATYIADQLNPSAGAVVIYAQVTTVYDLAVDNYVELIAYQNSGSTLTANATPNSSCEFSMQRIGT